VADEGARWLAEASAWRVMLSEAGAETTPEFEAWMSDPANESAWDQVMSSWVAVADHAESPALLVLRRNALDRAQREARRRWSPGWRIVAAACLVLLIGLGVFIAASVWRADQPITYATELGIGGL
jgi:transmembrane sensor